MSVAVTHSQTTTTIHPPAAGWDVDDAHRGIDDFFDKSKETMITIANSAASASAAPLVNLSIEGLKLAATATLPESAPAIHNLLEGARIPSTAAVAAIAPGCVKSTMNLSIPLSATVAHKSVDVIDRSVQWFNGSQ